MPPIESSANPAPLYVRSTRQEITAKSSTEAEILAVSDKLSDVIWLHLYLRDMLRQNEPIKPIILYQDNQSTMDLLEAGTACNGRSRHIQNILFWSSEVIQAGTILVHYLQTDRMPADMLTKPLALAVLIRHMKFLGFRI